MLAHAFGYNRQTLLVQVSTQLSLTEPRQGESLLDVWERTMPNLLPELIGSEEPPSLPFNRDFFLGIWPQLSLFGRRLKPYVLLSMFKRPAWVKGWRHADFFLHVKYDEISFERLIRFVEQVAIALEADLATINVITNRQLDYYRSRSVTADPILPDPILRNAFVYRAETLLDCIPDMYWLTIFGKPYLEMFGREKLLAAPQCSSRPIGEDHVALQLTNSLEEVWANELGYEEKKSALKRYLNERAFLSPEIERSQYVHPEFPQGKFGQTHLR
jgi:hypothetical protein